MHYRGSIHGFSARPGHLAVALLAATLLCNGCVLGPDYVRPDTDVPDSYRLPPLDSHESHPRGCSQGHGGYVSVIRSWGSWSTRH